MLVGYRQWLIIYLIHFGVLWSLQKQSCSSKVSAIYALDIYDILLSSSGCSTEYWFLSVAASAASRKRTRHQPFVFWFNFLIASLHLSEQQWIDDTLPEWLVLETYLYYFVVKEPEKLLCWSLAVLHYSQQQSWGNPAVPMFSSKMSDFFNAVGSLGSRLV